MDCLIAFLDGDNKVMNKICHVTSAHLRYDIRIFEKECVSLAKKGYDIFLVVNDNLSDEIKDGVHIVSTGFQPTTRKERMVDSMKYIWEKIKAIDADIYHFHDPELMQLFKKTRRLGKQVIFDAHEDTQEQIMDKKWIPVCFRKGVSILFAKYQKSVLKECNALVTVTPKMVEKLQKVNNNVHMITNYPIIEEKSVMPRQKYQEDYVFFAGGIGPQWCHEKIIEALEKTKGIKYRLAGPIEENYKKLLERTSGWKSVDYLGRIPHSEVEKEYRGAIAGMAINECRQIKGEGTLGNTKLFEVMAAGVPVICTNYRLWKEIINQYNCGICVNSENVDEIAEAIVYIKEHPVEAEIMGKQGRKAIEEQYNWKTQERVLYSLYRSLCEEVDE